jgi:hypothetical protein
MLISPKPTSGPRRCESVSGHNFRLARNLSTIGGTRALHGPNT